MVRFIITSIVFSLMLTACSSEDDVDLKNILPLESISFEGRCGWCAGGVSIIITKDKKVKYLKSSPCSPEDNVEKERLLTEEEIQGLNEVFELETFLAIDLDQCGKCYDGCDETIKVEGSKGENHFIRYDHFNRYSVLLEIDDLIEAVSEIRNSF